MSQHTSGPWRVGAPQSVDPEWLLVMTSGGAIVANVNGADEANARLIAAAPELLEALECIRDGMADDQAYRECARKAIAKAEGRE